MLTLVRALLVGFAVWEFGFGAQAATFVVTNTLSEGPGSLRQALIDASLSPGLDEISFSDVTGVIALSHPAPAMEDVTILGPGARHLTVDLPNVTIGPGRSTTLSGLRITSDRFVSSPDSGLLFNSGTLVIHDCEFVSISKISALGGAILNAGNLTISNSTFAENRTRGGGYPGGGCSPAHGGAIYVSDGTVIVRNTTFSGNFAENLIFLGYPDYFSCISRGGAVYVARGSAAFVNCTFSGNGAGIGADIYNSAGTVTLRNTILTGISAGIIEEAGVNLFTNATAAGLEPLGDYGGPTLTHALAPHSPAINQGMDPDAPPADQRGVPRPRGSRSDIGAFEFDPAPDHFELDLKIMGSGTVTRDPDAVFHPSNAVVRVTARALEDYRFVCWSGDDEGDANPLFVTMDGDKAIAARFEYFPLTVTNAAGATNHVINNDPWGPGSFRQAIRNLNASGGGAIEFPGVAGVIVCSLGLPEFQVNARIVGPGPTNLLLSIPPGVDSLAFGAGVTSSLSGMTIQSTQPPTRWGGAISNAGNLLLHDVHFMNCGASNGGAIFNSGRLEAHQCLFADNTATAGGAIQNQGSLSVLGSTFRGNFAFVLATDPRAGGGAFYNSTGEAAFVQCTFSGNAAIGLAEPWGSSDPTGAAGWGRGGAIYSLAGNLALFETLIVSNRAHGGEGKSLQGGQSAGSGGQSLGAGIYVQEGTLGLTNCALVRNTGQAGSSPRGSRATRGGGGAAAGGGIYLERGDAYALNCTFSGNEVRSGVSGGVGAGVLPPTGRDGHGGALVVRHGTALIQNCTITGNNALGGNPDNSFGVPGFGLGLGGGISSAAFFGSTGSVTLVNTILSGNFGATTGTNGIVPNDQFGPVVSLGHNLVGIGVDGLLPSDLVGLDPRLGPLQDNGGPTPTHALLAGSPAIDAGTDCPVDFDQRGQPRPVDNPALPNWREGPGTDIGALEVDHVLRLTGIWRMDTDICVSFTTVSDKVYGLDYKPELSPLPWTRLLEGIPGTGGSVTVTNAGVGLLPIRFYRAIEP